MYIFFFSFLKFEFLPQIIAIKPCENYGFAVVISSLAAEIVEIVEELSFVDADHIQL